MGSLRVWTSNIKVYIVYLSSAAPEVHDSILSVSLTVYIYKCVQAVVSGTFCRIRCVVKERKTWLEQELHLNPFPRSWNVSRMKQQLMELCCQGKVRAKLSCSKHWVQILIHPRAFYVIVLRHVLHSRPGRVEEAILKAICPGSFGRMWINDSGMFEASVQQGPKTINRTFSTPSKCHAFLLEMSVELHTGTSGKAALATCLLLCRFLGCVDPQFLCVHIDTPNA